MKNILKVLLVLMMMMSLLVFTACDNNDTEDPQKPNTGDIQTPGDTPGGGDNPPVTPPTTETETYKVDFVYSYTTKILNDFGRPTTKKEKITVKTIEVSVDNNGFTAEQRAEIADILYHGYGFAEWYEESNWVIDNEANTQMPTGDPYAFPEGKITSDFTLYGVKGDLAGRDATWEIEEVTDVNKDGETIVTDVILTISGKGDMFSFEDINAIDIPWYTYSHSELDPETGKMKEVRNYTSISKIVISPEITSIGWNAFNGLSGVKSVDFGENSQITTIGEAAFKGLSSLKSITTPSKLVTISKNAFDSTGLTGVWLNEGLETIDAGAFNGSKGISWIVLPATVKMIGAAAFHPGAGAETVAHSLSKVYYTGTAPADGSSIFDNEDIIDLRMDNDPLKYKATVYYYHEKNDSTEAPRGANWYYYSHTDADGVTTTQPMAYCLTLKYYLPGSPIVANWIDYVPAEPVWEKNNKTGMSVCKLVGTIDQENVDFREDKIEYNGYKFAGYGDDDKYTLNGAKSDFCVGAKVSDNMNCTLSRGKILSEGGGVIFGYSSNTISVAIDPIAVNDNNASTKIWNFAQPNDTAALWTGAQTGAKNVVAVNIEDGVEYIGSLTFNSLINVSYIVIPESVKGISVNAFTGCTNLLSIYYEGNLSDCKIYDKNGVITDKTLADEGVLEGLQHTSYYSFTDEPISEYGNYWTEIDGKFLAWKLRSSTVANPDGTEKTVASLFIGGDNEMVDFVNSTATPWYSKEVAESVTSVEFARNITAIGENLIHEYKNVTEILLPDNLQKLPSSAFAGTALLNSPREYPGGILIINDVLIKVDSARINSALFVIPYDTKVIAEDAFDGCDKIEELYIPLTVKSINQNSLAALSGLKIIYTDANTDAWKNISKNAGIKSSVFVCGYDENDLNGNKNTTELLWYTNKGQYLLWPCCPAGCQHENAYCKHSWGEWTVKQQPTHTTNGIRARQCTNPGCIAEDLDKETLLKKDEKVNNSYVHVFGQYKADNNSHCLTESTMTAKCLYCSQTDTKIIEGTMIGAHNFAQYIADNNNSCMQVGTVTAVCQNENCDAVDTKNDPVNQPKLDHVKATKPDGSVVDGTKVTLPACAPYEYSFVWYCANEGCKAIVEEIVDESTAREPGAHEWVEIADFRLLCERATLTTPNVYYYTCDACDISSKDVDGSTFEHEGSNIKLYDWDDEILKELITSNGKFDVNSNLDKFNYAVIAVENAKKVLEVGRAAGAADAIIRIKNSNAESVIRKTHVLETSFRMASVPKNDGFVYRLGMANSELSFFNLYFVVVKGKVVVKTGLDNTAETVAVLDNPTEWFDISVRYDTVGDNLSNNDPYSEEIVVNKQDPDSPDYDASIPEIKKTVYYYKVQIKIGDNDTYTHKQYVDDKSGIANKAFDFVESEISNTLDGAKFYFDNTLIRSIDLNNINKPENAPEGGDIGGGVEPEQPEVIVPDYTFDKDDADEDDGVLETPADGVTVTIKDGKKDAEGKYEYVQSQIVGGALNVSTKLNSKGNAFTSSTVFNIAGELAEGSDLNSLYVFQSKLIIGQGEHQLVFANKALSLHSFALNLSVNVDGLTIKDVNDGLDGESRQIVVSGIDSSTAFDLRVELYRVTTTSGQKLVAKIYVDGKYVGFSDSATLDGKKVASYDIESVALYHSVATDANITIDDVYTTKTNSDVTYVPEVVYNK